MSTLLRCCESRMMVIRSKYLYAICEKFSECHITRYDVMRLRCEEVMKCKQLTVEYFVTLRENGLRFLVLKSDEFHTP